MADPTPMMSRSQRRQAERMAAKSPPKPQPAAVRTAVAEPSAAAEPPKPEPRVIDGLEVDERGQVVLTDEEKADADLRFGVGVDPDATFGETAKKLVLLEAERDQWRAEAGKRQVALIKAKRRIKELESQRDTALAATNALAAPPTEDPTPEPEPAAD